MNTIYHYLEMIAKELKQILGTLCSERMALDDQLLPHKASAYYLRVSDELTEEAECVGFDGRGVG